MPPQKKAEEKNDPGKIEGKDKKQEIAQGKSNARNLKSMMKKLDQEAKMFQEMSRNAFYESVSDSAAFGLNRLEYQAAKVIALASVNEAFEKGQIEADVLQQQVHKATRKIAGDQSFKDWACNAYDTPGKMEKLGKMSPQELKADFVNSLSKDMMKQADQASKDMTKHEPAQKKQLHLKKK